MFYRCFFLIASILFAVGLSSSAQVAPAFALQFDGINDGVDMGAAKFPTVTNNFTMELWVKPGKARSNTVESTSGFAGITNESYAIFPELGSVAYGTTTHAGAGISIGTNGVSVVEHTAGYIPTLLVQDVVLTNWTHVAVVYSNRQPFLYINGSFVKSGFVSPKAFVHASVALSEWTTGYGPFKGQLDEVRIWDAVRNPSQIQTNQYIRLNGAESNLVAYYRFDEGSGTSTADATTNNRTGTLTNGVTWVPAGAPIATTAAATLDSFYPTATLNGSVNPNNVSSTAWFQWGLTTNYGNTTTPQVVRGTGTNFISFSQSISNLVLTNIYHYRIVAINSRGSITGLDQTFLLKGPPAASTLPATFIKQTSATLNGTASLANVSSDVWFEWGTSPGLGNIAPVVPRHSLLFNGSSDYVNVGTNKFSTVQNNFTMEFMVYPTAARAESAQSDIGIAGVANQRYAIFPDLLGNAGSIHGAGVSVGTNGISIFEHAAGLLASTLVYSNSLSGWNHVAVVYTGRRPSLFLNGTLVAVGQLSYGTVVRPSANFGESGLGYGYYAGLLDEVRIWSSSLSQTTLQQWMNQETLTNHPSYGNLIGHWSMNEGTGTVAYDTSAQANDGLLVNSTSWLVDASAVSVPLNALSPNTTYYYRVATSNSLGVAFGSILNFTTTADPYAVTENPTGVSVTSATLNGSINPNGTMTGWQFQWGTTTNYGNATSFTSAGNGTNFVSVATSLTNVLTPDASHHYRVVATNSFGTAYGSDVLLQTASYFFSNAGGNFPVLDYEQIQWGDYDNDGLLDVLLVNRDYTVALTQLWRNTGSGTFSNVNVGLTPVIAGDAVWGDYDNDGFLDILLSGQASSSVVTEIWRNLGNGTFTNINAGLTGVQSGAVAWGDYDNDGLLDVLLSGHSATTLTTEVWRNCGNGVFTNINLGISIGGYSSVAWGDYDNDGRLDLVVTGNSLVSYYNSELWHNTGNGSFTKINAGLNPLIGIGGTAWGDYDNDGFLDLLLAGWNGSDVTKAYIWRNNGDGTFANINASLTADAYGCAWGDYDNDGRLDLVLSSFSTNEVRRNLGNGTFTNLSLNLPIGAMMWGDYDNDNRLDFLNNNQLRHNDVGAANAAPTSPTGLASMTNGRTVTLSWNSATDDTTPAAGLTYNIRIGSSPGAGNIVHPSSSSNGRRRLAQMGNVQNGTNALFMLGSGLHYWSVQAIDAAFVGSAFSTNGSFLIRPECTLKTVTNFSVTTATLEGTVLAGTTTNSFRFLYGTNGLFNQSAPLQTIRPGQTFVPVAALLTNLAPGTTYNYKLSVMTDVGDTNSSSLSFTTLTEDRPTILSVVVTNLSTNSAVLTATIVPNNQATTARFYYENAVNGFGTDFQTFSGSLSNIVMTALVTNLIPGTTYNFYLVAENGLGTTVSPHVAFQTPVPPFKVTSTAVQANGRFSFQFNGLANASYTVLLSTNLSTWDVIGTATQVSPGSFQFIDTGSTNQTKRFYLLRSP